MIQNIPANSVKSRIDVNVLISQNIDTKIKKICIANSVGFDIFDKAVLFTVNFNYRLRLGDIEINNIISNALLSFYGNRQFFQKIVPKMIFLVSHIFS